jgi:hypothetical protein
VALRAAVSVPTPAACGPSRRRAARAAHAHEPAVRAHASATLREACAPGFGRQGEKAGIGQGPYLAVGVRIQDTGPPRRAAIIYTIQTVIFTVYVYRVITLGNNKQAPRAGPVSLFHSPTFQAWFNHDPHRYEYRLPHFMARYERHGIQLSKQHLPQTSQAVKCDTSYALSPTSGHVRHFVSHTSAACPTGLRQDEGMEEA